MRVLCPHCQNSVELTDFDPRTDIACPSCGSTFRLAGEPTAGGPASVNATTVPPFRLAGTSTTGPAGPDRKTVGRFEVLETVGSGAFGTVYKARDAQLDRVVAVKVPRAGTLATDADRDRFLREARSAAQLRHPSIVAVHEVGEADGVPFLVADLVPGVTLTDLLTARRPPPAEAARIVAAVADALQYAHAHGVVHRDVKSSNIMIGADGTPVVMDFGLARRDAGEATLTADGQVLGTPAYMSPEQARGEGHAVDGRSDVYSLGVVLYQLLTGELPFRGNVRMLLHQVLHDEPRPPRSLNDGIPRDLDTICQTAMRKEPRNRYPTAGAMADDLGRFLRNEPIVARPVGRVGKAWRWARRNRAVAGLLAALAAALAGGLGATTWLWLRAEDRRTQAVRAQQNADEHRDRAERSYRLARETLDQCFTKVKDDPRMKQGPLEDLRRVLLQAEAHFFLRFAELHGDDPQFRAERATALFQLGQATRELGSVEEAIGHYREALAAFAGLARDHPTDPDFRKDLAMIHNNLAVLYAATGRSPDAEAAYAEAIRLQQALVAEHRGAENYQVELARSYLNLGNVHLDANRFGAAEQVLRNALGVPRANGSDTFAGPRGRAVQAKVHLNLGIGYVLTNDHTRAEEEFHLARDLFDGLSREEPAHREHRDDLAKALSNASEVYRMTGRVGDAVTALERARDVLRALVRAHPGIAGYRSVLAATYINLGLCEDTRGREGPAEGHLTEALSILDTLVRDHPTVAAHRAALAAAHAVLGNVHLCAERTDQAEREFRKSLDVRQALVREHPKVPEYRYDLATAHGNLGNVYLHTKKPDAADKAFRDALAVFDGLAKEYPAAAEYAISAAITRANLGKLAVDRGRPKDSLPLFAEAEAVIGSILVKEPRHAHARAILRNIYVDRARVLMKLKQPADALADWDRAMEFDDGRFREDIRDGRAVCHFALDDRPRALAEADALAGLGTATGPYRAACLYARAVSLAAADPAESDRHGARAVELLRQAVGKGFKNHADIRKDPDLDPLRGREDFRKFLDGLPKPMKPDSP